MKTFEMAPILIQFKTLIRKNSHQAQWRYLATSPFNKYLSAELDWRTSSWFCHAHASNYYLDVLAERIMKKMEWDNGEYTYIPAALLTMEQDNQRIHVDFTQLFANEEDIPWVFHAPLCREGAWLNVISIIPNAHTTQTEVTPLRVHIPFGNFILLKGTVPHSGVYGQPGNLRSHMVFGKPHIIVSKKLRFLDNIFHPDLPSAADCAPNQIEVTDEDPKHIPALEKIVHPSLLDNILPHHSLSTPSRRCA